MSYAVQLDKIAKSNVSSARRRLERLEAQLAALERGPGVAAQDALGREMQSLERLVLAMPERELQAKAVALRSRLDKLCAGKVVSEVGQADGGWRQGNPAEEAAAPHMEEQTESVRHVASFLQKPEDDVRLLAAQGTLSEELSKYPALGCANSGAAVFLSVRPWSEEDDQAENERRHLAVLEISQAATNLQEITALMGKQIAQDQEALNAVEATVAHTREVTEKAVVILAEAAGQKQSQWVLPTLTLTLAGGVATLTCPATAAAAAARGVLLFGSSMVSYSTMVKIQNRVIDRLKDQLPRVFQPLPDEEAAMIREGSQEACARLQRKLDELGRWTEESTFQRLRKFDLFALRREVLQRFTILSAESDVRKGGHAYAISFTAAVPPIQAFRLLQRNMAAGSIDPACKVMWSRPLQAEDGSVHSIRYLAFTEWFVGRDFFCTCFCGKVQRGDDKECYVMAMTSLSEDLLKAEGLPKPIAGHGHGRIYVSGIRFTAVQDGSKVEVMVDTDPDAPLGYISDVVDKRIRSHACDVAWVLQRQLHTAGGGARQNRPGRRGRSGKGGSFGPRGSERAQLVKNTGEHDKRLHQFIQVNKLDDDCAKILQRHSKEVQAAVIDAYVPDLTIRPNRDDGRTLNTSAIVTSRVRKEREKILEQLNHGIRLKESMQAVGSRSPGASPRRRRSSSEDDRSRSRSSPRRSRSEDSSSGRSARQQDDNGGAAPEGVDIVGAEAQGNDDRGRRAAPHRSVSLSRSRSDSRSMEPKNDAQSQPQRRVVVNQAEENKEDDTSLLEICNLPDLISRGKNPLQYLPELFNPTLKTLPDFNKETGGESVLKAWNRPGKVGAILLQLQNKALAASACRTLNGLEFLGNQLKVQGIPKLEADGLLQSAP
ncbi:unnamed protein product [Symbiodinium necroappetens]|uniref:Uncharacterized protein n=1 Tax=Symbiodinium necroappetens TaxID=1628268 RepID=A0A812R147_9DINO|nr:unnamed protein product [Symbiodinium necroappetens]